MESSYGIGITNRYSCFLDNDDDPVEALIKTEVDSKETKKKEATAGSGGTTTTTAPAPRKGIRDSNKGGNIDTTNAKQSNRINNGVNQGRGGGRGGNRPGGPPFGGPDRNVKFNNEDEREERNNRRNLSRDENREGGGGRPEGDSARGRRPFQRGGGGGGGRGGQERRGGGTGGGPGGGGGRGPPGERGPMRKREFDRQSGSDKSGVKPVDKRDGAGSRNWGTYKDDIEEISGTPVTTDETMEEKPEAVEITETGDAGEEKVAADQTEGEPTEPTEEQPKLMTLDEWKALQQPRQKPVFNLRKAGEGEDQTQWKKMILKKKEKEEQSGEDEEYEEDYDCPQRAGRQKQVLEIDFHFTDSRRGGGGRGGGRGGGERGRGGEHRERGGDRSERTERSDRAGGERGDRGAERGGGERGEHRRGGMGRFEERGRGRAPPRSDRYPPRQTAPKVDDVNDFPSLG